ncbi:MAG TPA: cellulase family glycosylhydrolase [Verrucomicrobiae bacterium]|nr:cellulase family glycosylhydrolase [Verrucomicrobiae bacterium]
MKYALISFALAAAMILPVFAQTGDDSFVPSNPPQMRRLTDSNSPAWQASKLFMRGVNLGNYLESPPDADWGVTVAASEFYTMKHEDFDHVRIPIGWQYYVGAAPDYTLSPEIFSRADFAVTNALAAGLAGKGSVLES